jgi:hypothetical protein
MAMLVTCCFAHGLAADDQLTLRTAEEIRQEATRANRGEAGRPLPLAAHWNSSGARREGFTPLYQLQLIRQGHHLLPWLEWPPTDHSLATLFKPGDPRRQQYIDDQVKLFEPAVKELARLRLPLSFLGTQWECDLTYDDAFLKLPAEKNPNVVGLDGKVQPRVCPFGPVEPWREVGRRWTDGEFLRRIQGWYPDPPLVLLVSNNEHAKLPWTEVEQSRRYLDKYGRGRPDDFKRKVVGDGWIERYRAMLDGMRAGLASEHWRKHVKFIGYEAFPPSHFGRWGGWKEYWGGSSGRLDPQVLCWDGGSPSYYLHNWMALTDYTLWSPQVESMNWVFMLDDVHRARPEFWFEMSTWDGDQPGAGNDKRRFYARQGQLFTPARYEGFVQYGMWLTRPRAVREFRGWLETVEYAGPFFQAIVRAVDRVYANPVLRRFWRGGTLVANPRGRHPFQSDIPPEYKNAARWFLLDTSLTPRKLRAEEFDNARPPAIMTEIPVFALALVAGAAPKREWLLYANAPREARVGVEITLPGYGAVTVDAPQSGSFYYVQEGNVPGTGHRREALVGVPSPASGYPGGTRSVPDTKQATAVERGGPASFRIEAPSFLDAGAEGTFQVAEKFTPAGAMGPAQWDFGDGARATGDRAVHRYTKPGQYLVAVSGSQGGADLVRRQVPVFVGMTPDEALACRLLMKGTLAAGMKSWLWLGDWEKVDYHFIPDASGRGNIGFLAGGTWVNDPQRGTVLELDGQHDRVEISNSPEINSGGPYPNRTVALWFRAAGPERPQTPAAKTPPKTQRQVLYEEGGPGAGVNLYLDGDTLYAGAWNQGKGAWLPAKKLAAARWHHAAAVLRSAKPNDREVALELYLDGQGVGQAKVPLLGAHPGDINLGRAGSTLFHDGRALEQPDHYFKGRIDDFRISNRALTAEEMRTLAQGAR